ncbi:hypothetical protein ACHMZP_34200 [Rhodococcus baikonurensis]|uniref:hypothetical protein n=1 Tax=Rhodococcus baikonurensis TaxID=172041 RepID=UPI003792AC8E
MIPGRRFGDVSTIGRVSKTHRTPPLLPPLLLAKEEPTEMLPLSSKVVGRVIAFRCGGRRLGGAKTIELGFLFGPDDPHPT